MILILSFTVISATAMVGVGLELVDSQQRTTELGAAENELAMFGSKVSEVALGDAPVQSVSVASKDGTYRIEESTATIELVHLNRTGPNTEEPIEKVEIGEVVYESDGTTIAYQGGGVWKNENGHTTMVSPPEFHYRYGTLTLPIINVTGDGHATGSPGTITVTSDGDPKRIYPNSTNSNPIENGSVEVRVKSEYYRGWEAYFEERTQGDVSLDEENNTAIVDLVTFGDDGYTPLEDGSPIVIRAAEEDDPVNDFNLTLVSDDPSDLNNLDWRLEIDGREAVHLHGKGNGDVDVTIVDPDDTDWEWEADAAFQAREEDGDGVVHANLSSRDVDAEHVNEGTDAPLGEVFNELIERHGPDVELTVEDKSGKQRVNHDKSIAFVDYEGEGFVTYLQVTENEVTVRFE